MFTKYNLQFQVKKHDHNQVRDFSHLRSAQFKLIEAPNAELPIHVF